MITAEYKNRKWAILDGDFEAHWLEDMNSDLGDNKVFTLVLI